MTRISGGPGVPVNPDAMPPNDGPVAVGPPGAGIVAACARLVPSDRRAEWQAEWIGELTYAWQVRRQAGGTLALARASLLMRAIGAVSDAFWFRRRYGGDSMLSQD